MTLKQIIALTFSYYNRGQTCSDDLIDMYASDLADLDQAQVATAYQEWRRNAANRTFPLPAQIRDMIEPQITPEFKAREIAARITGAVPQFGWNNGKAAEAFIGPDGWALVQRIGGWQYLCENLGHRLSVTTLQAQLRDQLEGTLRYGAAAVERSLQIVGSEKRTGLGLSPASDVIKKITGDFEPEGEGA